MVRGDIRMCVGMCVRERDMYEDKVEGGSLMLWGDLWMCVCVCVCVCEREREREKDRVEGGVLSGMG